MESTEWKTTPTPAQGPMELWRIASKLVSTALGNNSSRYSPHLPTKRIVEWGLSIFVSSCPQQFRLWSKSKCWRLYLTHIPKGIARSPPSLDFGKTQPEACRKWLCHRRWGRLFSFQCYPPWWTSSRSRRSSQCKRVRWWATVGPSHNDSLRNYWPPSTDHHSGGISISTRVWVGTHAYCTPLEGGTNTDKGDRRWGKESPEEWLLLCTRVGTTKQMNRIDICLRLLLSPSVQNNYHWMIGCPFDIL